MNNMLDYEALARTDYRNKNPFITDCIQMWNEQSIEEKRIPYERHWKRIVWHE